MLKNRTFWLALLIPLLLGLLVVFAKYSSGDHFQAGIEERSFNAQKSSLEVEEWVEEDTFSFGLLQSFRSEVVCPVVYSRCRFFSFTPFAAPLASGWVMPLRI
ncbi:hypothetical protein [Pontiella sulfatireligans]|uniref:Uncharacterized protein n=1 Tax=Pontiella sulfatireligans TaxID=2750658 RepID=A0A6C2UMY2_9BACT|nr:hypothetical protein [Pontiella sulfatireligans]VGO20621.1 hypothetical protein SCARR_02686 [Pontiella sulfatireligans]